MISSDMSLGFYSDSSDHDFSTAHSGPELVSCVPEPGLAQELARELLNDYLKLTRITDRSISQLSSGNAAGFTIGLAKR